MSISGYKALVTEPELNEYVVQLVGQGAAAPLKNLGRNITVSRLGVGSYRLTFAERGVNWVFAGANYVLQATTPSAMAGCTLVLGDYDFAGNRIDIALFSGGTTPAARELALNTEKINMTLAFKATRV